MDKKQTKFHLTSILFIGEKDNTPRTTTCGPPDLGNTDSSNFTAELNTFKTELATVVLISGSLSLVKRMLSFLEGNVFLSQYRLLVIIPPLDETLRHKKVCLYFCLEFKLKAMKNH